MAPKSHKKDDMYGREIVIQIEIIYVCRRSENITKFTFFFHIIFSRNNNPHSVEPKSKWKKATTKIKTLNALTTQYSDEHMREDIGDAVVISEDQAQCSKKFFWKKVQYLKKSFSLPI